MMNAVQEASLAQVNSSHRLQEAVCNHQLRTSTKATPSLRACLDRARCLAAILNHPQLDTLHVVVEMALDQYGRRSFKWSGIDPDTARANCLKAVVRIAPTCPSLPQEQIGETHDLLNVWRVATEIMMQRDEHQAISMDDFVKALLSVRPCSTLEVIQEAETQPLPERVLAAIQDAFARFERQTIEPTASQQRLIRIEETLEEIKRHLPKPAPEPVGVLHHLARVARIAVLTVGATFVVFLSH
jgi:hypothetical protein